MTTSVDVIALLHEVELSLMIDGRSEEQRQLVDARAAVADLIEAVGALRSRLLVSGEIVDGCYYYNGYSATELQTPMADVEAALARVKGV